jgi:SAM-dependent methyltransferase
MTEPTVTMELPFPDAAYDFAFSGRFPLRAPERSSRIALARELHRVLRAGGSLLLAMGNRLCPVDFTRNGPLLHGLSARSCLSYFEAYDLLVREAAFKNVTPLNVAGHFGWGRLPPVLSPVGKLINAYWRWLVTPSRTWLYTSPLNPTLLLWVNKD